jgi:hypothetical protein
MTRGKKTYVDTPRGDSLPRCALRGKIGNLKKVGGIYKKYFYRGIAKHTNFAGVLAYLPKKH